MTQPRTTSGRRIASVAGIDVRLHPTFLLIVAAAAVGLFGPPLAAFVWLAALFTSVVVHELAHSLVARRRGIGVRDIVLLPIGGVSEMERLPDRPRDELTVALAGPFASFGIAGIGAVLAFAFGLSLVPVEPVTGSLLHRIVWMNVLLGAFNLVPAFPLDGGRVLRALLVGRYGLEQATRVAATVGRTGALCLGGLGLLFDLWLVFIAVFIYFGSTAEETATLVHLRLRGLHVADVMVSEPATLDVDAVPAELSAAARRSSQPVFPVLAAGHVIGAIDRSRLLAAPHDGAWSLATDVPLVAPDADLEEATAAIAASGRTAGAVVADGSVVGLLVLADVRTMLDHAGPARVGHA